MRAIRYDHTAPPFQTHSFYLHFLPTQVRHIRHDTTLTTMTASMVQPDILVPVYVDTVSQYLYRMEILHLFLLGPHIEQFTVPRPVALTPTFWLSFSLCVDKRPT